MTPLNSSISHNHLLLLGATGFFGREFLPRLFNGHLSSKLFPKVTILTRSKSRVLASFPYLADTCTILEHNLLYASEIAISEPVTHVLHMANMSARDTFNGAEQYDKYRLLLNSSLLIRQLSTQHPIERIVFTSSGAAYGLQSSYVESALPIIDPHNTELSLAFGKLTAEFILSSSISGSNRLSIARCFSFVGAHLPCDIHYAIGNFVRNAVEEADIVIRTDGSDIRSYQHISDAVRWIMRLIIMSDPPALINIGSDHAISILNLAHTVKRITKSNSKITILNQQPISDNHRRASYVPDLTLAHSFGFVNKVSLEDSIAELALSYQRSST